MREQLPYKITNELKAVIIAHAIEGKTIKESARILRDEHGVDVNTNTIWIHRTKAKKRIARALEDEMDRAVAMVPIATLENRLLVLERVIEEGFGEHKEAVEALLRDDLAMEFGEAGDGKDDGMNPQVRAALEMKAARALGAVNDAVKIADAAVNRMRALQQKLKEYNAKNNLGTRDLVEETIIAVQRKVYSAHGKASEKKGDMKQLAGEVDWIEDGDLDDTLDGEFTEE